MSKKVKNLPYLHFGICAPCFEFSSDEVHHEKRTVVIVPIVIEENEEGNIQLSWGCSRAPNCMDGECRYSRGKRRSPEEQNSAIEHFGAYGDR